MIRDIAFRCPAECMHGPVQEQQQFTLMMLQNRVQDYILVWRKERHPEVFTIQHLS